MLLWEIKNEDDLSTIGRKAKLAMQQWKSVASKADHGDFVHDVELFDFGDYTDEQLGKIIMKGTATNLKAMGFDGPRSDESELTSMIYTAALHHVKDEYGRQSVKIGKDEKSFRGVRKDKAAEAFVSTIRNIADELLRMSESGTDRPRKVSALDMAVSSDKGREALHSSFAPSAEVQQKIKQKREEVGKDKVDQAFKVMSVKQFAHFIGLEL